MRDCAQMAELLREKSSFALRLTATQRILPHAMVMKIQCGGLDGLQGPARPCRAGARRAAPGAPGPRAYGDFGELPFSEVVQGVAAWKPRRRHAGEPR
jgi:hypothetical protein